jgi:Ni/Fe-hydrogenase 1 B-type cytochrome subunit
MAAVSHPGASKSPGGPRRAVYVFEWPVRIIHWTIVATLIVLSFSGYYLHHPFLGGQGAAGRPGFAVGDFRFVHEVTAFVFTAAVLARVYWAFMGNRYAHWRALMPITRKQRRDARAMLLYYTLVRRHPPRTIGHNPLAGLAYLALYALFVLSILTGFGLYAWVGRIPAWQALFGWTYGLVPIEQLRLVHFLLMFVFGAFAIHHVYSAVLIDLEERNGELSSIVTGYKAIPLEWEVPGEGPEEAEA